MVVTGDLYLDGSLLDGRIHVLRRGGWAWVMLIESDDPFVQPQLGRARRGTLPGWHQTSLHAEYYAPLDLVLMAKRAGRPPFCFICDHDGIILACNKGKGYCCSVNRPSMHIWAVVWDWADSVGPHLIVFLMVKAHLDIEAIEFGQITLERFTGNSIVDFLAKEGAAVHRVPVRGRITCWKLDTLYREYLLLVARIVWSLSELTPKAVMHKAEPAQQDRLSVIKYGEPLSDRCLE